MYFASVAGAADTEAPQTRHRCALQFWERRVLPGHRDDGTAGVPLSREEASETHSRTIHEPAFRNFPLEP
jgi:hypothetical protein